VSAKRQSRLRERVSTTLRPRVLKRKQRPTARRSGRIEPRGRGGRAATGESARCCSPAWLAGGGARSRQPGGSGRRWAGAAGGTGMCSAKLRNMSQREKHDGARRVRFGGRHGSARTSQSTAPRRKYNHRRRSSMSGGEQPPRRRRVNPDQNRHVQARAHNAAQQPTQKEQRQRAKHVKPARTACLWQPPLLPCAVRAKAQACGVVGRRWWCVV